MHVVRAAISARVPQGYWLGYCTACSGAVCLRCRGAVTLAAAGVAGRVRRTYRGAYRLVFASRCAGADFALCVVSYRAGFDRFCITQKLR